MRFNEVIQNKPLPIYRGRVIIAEHWDKIPSYAKDAFCEWKESVVPLLKELYGPSYITESWFSDAWDWVSNDAWDWVSNQAKVVGDAVSDAAGKVAEWGAEKVQNFLNDLLDRGFRTLKKVIEGLRSEKDEYEDKGGNPDQEIQDKKEKLTSVERRRQNRRRNENASAAVSAAGEVIGAANDVDSGYQKLLSQAATWLSKQGDVGKAIVQKVREIRDFVKRNPELQLVVAIGIPIALAVTGLSGGLALPFIGAFLAGMMVLLRGGNPSEMALEALLGMIPGVGRALGAVVKAGGRQVTQLGKTSIRKLTGKTDDAANTAKSSGRTSSTGAKPDNRSNNQPVNRAPGSRPPKDGEGIDPKTGKPRKPKRDEEVDEKGNIIKKRDRNVSAVSRTNRKNKNNRSRKDRDRKGRSRGRRGRGVNLPSGSGSSDKDELKALF